MRQSARDTEPGAATDVGRALGNDLRPDLSTAG